MIKRRRGLRPTKSLALGFARKESRAAIANFTSHCFKGMWSIESFHLRSEGRNQTSIDTHTRDRRLSTDIPTSANRRFIVFPSRRFKVRICCNSSRMLSTGYRFGLTPCCEMFPNQNNIESATCTAGLSDMRESFEPKRIHPFPDNVPTKPNPRELPDFRSGKYKSSDECCLHLFDKQDGTVPGGKTKNPVSEIEVSLFLQAAKQPKSRMITPQSSRLLFIDSPSINVNTQIFFR